MPLSSNILFQDEHAKVWIQEDILCIEYKENAVVDLEVQKRHIDIRMKITGKNKMPMFCNASKGSYWTSEARNYSIKHYEGITATAILIVDSLVQKTLLNFFMKFLNIPVPFRAFTNKEVAMEWLQQYKVAQHS